MCKSVKKYGDDRANESAINTKLESVKNIMDGLNYSVDKALDLLKITGKERTIIANHFAK